MTELSILYRGSLSSCNYDCHYCPFAKHHQTAAELRNDLRQLDRFVNWVIRRQRSTEVFFTPWGEALTRPWYQDAIRRLSQASRVQRVAAQTNLSCPLGWLDDCDSSRIGLWCTYHPSQVDREAFLAQCRELTERGVAHSVGMVGLPEDFEEIEKMRAELPASTYLWINAWEVTEGRKYRYSPAEIERLERIDPHFRTNTIDHISRGRACECGTQVISVDGEGQVFRCHFVSKSLGNIYLPDWEDQLIDRPCPNTNCGCHIGYVHMPELGLRSVYGERILERIPLNW